MKGRVLITGAGGFVGRHLAAFLSKQGLEIHGLDRPGVLCPKKWTGEWHNNDVTDAQSILKTLQLIRPDYLFHLAALIKSDDLVKLLKINVIGTQSVLHASKEACPKACILVTGSAAEYGLIQPEQLPIQEDTPLRPYSNYGISKATQSMIAAQFYSVDDLPIYQTRTFNLTGPGEPESLVCAAFTRQIAEIEAGFRKPVMEVGNLNSARDFVDVRDAVKAYWAVIRSGDPGRVYNVCSGKATTIREILDSLLQMTQFKVSVHEEKRFLTRWDVPIQIGSFDLIRNATGWQPEIPLEKSLSDNLQYWRDRLLH